IVIGQDRLARRYRQPVRYRSGGRRPQSRHYRCGRQHAARVLRRAGSPVLHVARCELLSAAGAEEGAPRPPRSTPSARSRYCRFRYRRVELEKMNAGQSTGPSAAAAQSEMAERLDAAGRHDEAIDCLARATQRGDVEAKTRLAKRLIVGDRAPLLLREGVTFMHEA